MFIRLKMTWGTLEGGYDAAWLKQSDLFSAVSSLTVTSGTLIVDQIVLNKCQQSEKRKMKCQV
jgi:hypothetical protein